MEKNCVIVSRTAIPMFWAGGTTFSAEYPDAALLTETAAIRRVKTLRKQITFMACDAVRDYGLDSQETIYRS